MKVCYPPLFAQGPRYKKNEGADKMDYMNHLYGRSTKIVKEFDRGTIHKIETREHKICYVTVYPIFAGVNIMFNDIHATKLDVPRDCPDDGI